MAGIMFLVLAVSRKFVFFACCWRVKLYTWCCSCGSVAEYFRFRLNGCFLFQVGSVQLAQLSLCVVQVSVNRNRDEAGM